MHVSLTPTLEEFVQEKVESGRYNNASEVVREALRLLQDYDEVQQLKLKKLRAALTVGEADLKAGRVTTFATDKELEEFFARL